MKIKKQIITIIIASVLCIAFFIVAFTGNTTSNSSTTNNNLIVTKEIKVTSDCTNALFQTYKSTFSGTIKNISNKDIDNLVLIVSVETTTLKNQGAFSITIDKLKAGATYNIYSSLSTEQNFEKVTDITYKYDGIISNKTLTNKVTNENSNENAVLIGGLICAFICIVIIIVESIKIVNKKKRYYESLRLARIEEEKAEEEKQREYNLQLQYERINNEKLKHEAKKLAIEEEKLNLEKEKLNNSKPIICEYCGTKNSHSNTCCSACGATLK